MNQTHTSAGSDTEKTSPWFNAQKPHQIQFPVCIIQGSNEESYLPSDLELILDALERYRVFLQTGPTASTMLDQYRIDSLTEMENELRNYAFQALSDLSIHLRSLKALDAKKSDRQQP